MKILLLVDWVYPCDHPFLEEVYNKNLSNEGFEIVWVMRSDDERQTVTETNWNGDQVYILPKSAYDPVRTLGFYFTKKVKDHPVSKIISDHSDTDIIHVRNDLAFGIVVSKMKDQIEARYIHQISHLKAETLLESIDVGLTESSYKPYIKGLSGKRLRKYVCNQADLVLPIGIEMQNYLQERGYTSPMTPLTTGARTDVNPAEIDEYPFIKKYDLYEHSVLLYMGSMNPLRRLEFLFDVLCQMDNENIRLLMIGGRDEDHRTRLKRLANNKSVEDKVIFTGWISDQTILNRAICAADVGLSPLPPEGVLRTNAPIKTLEYLSLETPVVATDTPDQRAVVENSGCGQIADYDPTQFAEEIQFVLHRNKEYSNLNCREYLSEYRSYRHLSDKTKNIYLELLR